MYAVSFFPSRYRYNRQPFGRSVPSEKDATSVPPLILITDSLRMFFATLSNILGAVILIAIVLPYFLIAVVTISAAYLWAAMFYRASARELKVGFTVTAQYTV